MICTRYDQAADELSVRFGPADAESDGFEEVAPGVFLEFDRTGDAISLKITRARTRSPWEEPTCAKAPLTLAHLP
jgi:hypothetical protein